MTSREQELLVLSQRLLDCIAAGDWSTYEQLCDPTLSAFEAEARGHLVEGLDFHRFYFQGGSGGPAPRKLNTITSPHVRFMGSDAAVVSYVRLIQKQTPDGAFSTDCCEETRVWQKIGGAWKHVHFHRSGNR
jgi:calcium/calmodulin-dependent protein kinase (CaM kinase) II